MNVQYNHETDRKDEHAKPIIANYDSQLSEYKIDEKDTRQNHKLHNDNHVDFLHSKIVTIRTNEPKIWTSFNPKDTVDWPPDEPETSTAAVPANVVIPPDGGWGWVVVFASFCCNLVVDGIIYSFGTMLTEISGTFNESKATTALIGSLLSGTYLIVGPFASALANRYGFRNLMIIGSIISTIAFFLSSYATSIQFLLITYGILGGIGFGFIFVPSIIVIGFYFEKWRALATGIAVCGAGIGTFLMAPITAAIIERYNWRVALVIQAGFLLSCSIFGALYRPLEQALVTVSVDKEEKKSSLSKKKMSIIIQTTKTTNGGSRLDKSESLLNVYEDSGITIGSHSTELYNFFNNNSKYPTAMQIFGADKRASFTESVKKSSQSLNNAAQTQIFVSDSLGRHSTISKLVKDAGGGGAVEEDSKKKETTSDWKIDNNKSKDQQQQQQNKNAGNFWIPEMKTLLSRKHSLRSTYKSQSFTEHNTRIDQDTSKSARRNTVGRSDFRNRPLYRDDIFFNSSLKRLPQYRSHASSIDYTMSVTRLPTYTDVMEEQKSSKCNLCSEAVRRVLATMLNMSLIQSPTFMLLAFSGFATSMGLYVPFIYITDRAKHYNISEPTAIWLISTVGVANTLGRVGFGILSSIPNTNALFLNNVSLSICGISTILSASMSSTVFQFSYATVFGLTIACFSTLRTIIVVDLLGLEKLTNAFGLLLLFQGIAAVIGPPTAGFFVDRINSYDTSFHIAGALILLSAVMCYPIGTISRWENSRHDKNNSPETNV